MHTELTIKTKFGIEMFENGNKLFFNLGKEKNDDFSILN